MATVFVPLSWTEAVRLAGGEVTARAIAYADTPGLRLSYDFRPAQQEEARYAALLHAGLAALLLPGRRLVVAADVAPAMVTGGDDPFGRVETGLRWGQVQALFTDEPAAAADVQQARRWAGGRGLAELAADRRIVDLVEPWDLLWYAPQELNQLEQ